MMKRILIIILLASTIWSLSAQTTTTALPLALRMDLVTWVNFVEKDYLAGGKVGTLEITVKHYDVYQTASGQYYIEYINSKLTKSRKYLGWTHGINGKYEGNSIFYNADITKAWMWTIDRYGQIYKMELPDWFATDAKKQLNQK